MADLSLIDAEFGSTLHRDTEEFRRASTGMVEAPNAAGYSSTAQENSYCAPAPGGLLRSHMDTLIRVHRASGSGSHMRGHTLRDMPSDVPPWLRARHPSKGNPTKRGDIIAAMDACDGANGLPLFWRSRKPGEFLRLEIDAPM